MKHDGAASDPRPEEASALGFLDDELGALEARNLLRHRVPPWPGPRPSFCSNDYLGLATRAPPERSACGAGASRLVTGEKPEHGALERDLANWLGVEDALVFATGYAANTGAIAALAGPGDVVVSDALNHASIIDGIRLSRAAPRVVAHADVAAVGRALAAGGFKRAFVAVESYFSMDADGPDLGALAAMCRHHRAALIVDEAHALGVLGPAGRGLCAQAGVRPDVLVGTLGKAIGVQGGFVAGDRRLTAWLWNRARSFVFSTGISPRVAACARDNLAVARGADDSRARVAGLARRLRDGMSRLGLDVLGHDHIVPWVLGTPERTMRAAAALRDRGFDVRGIRPPTVPEGTGRVRMTVTAAHSHEDIDALLAALDDVSRETVFV